MLTRAEVEQHIYWRDPKLSALIFGTGLVILLSLAYYSVISVVANSALYFLLVPSILYRLYKEALQILQKNAPTPLISGFLNQEIQLPTEKTHELVDILIVHVNATLAELKRLFLVEDFINSLKFALVLYIATYVGSWFNGLTLVIIGFVLLFTLPKLYENNKIIVDEYVGLLLTKFEEISNKVKAVVPMLNRPKPVEKKE